MKTRLAIPAITFTALALAAGCDPGDVKLVGEMYATSLPPGGEDTQWDCSSNGVGQVACETDKANIPSNDEWTCSACNQGVAQTSADADKGNVDTDGEADVDEECATCKECDHDRDAADGCGRSECEHSFDLGFDNPLDKATPFGPPARDKDTLRSFVEALKAQLQELKQSMPDSSEPAQGLGYDKGQVPEDEGQIPEDEGQVPEDKGQIPELPSYDKGEQPDAPFGDNGVAQGQGDQPRNKDNKDKTHFELPDRFPQRTSSHTACVRSGLPRGHFRCSANKQAGRVLCQGQPSARNASKDRDQRRSTADLDKTDNKAPVRPKASDQGTLPSSGDKGTLPSSGDNGGVGQQGVGQQSVGQTGK